MTDPAVPRSNRRVVITIYAPIVLWIGVILFLGSGAGSMEHTSLVIRPILEFLFPNASAETLTIYHGLIRKAAHFVEYAVLAILIYRAIPPRRALSILGAALPVASVLVVAVIDEFGQGFNLSRTSSFADVILDTLGGAAGAMTMIVIAFLRQRHRSTR